MAQWLQPHMLFVSATKGIENDTLLRMTEVIHEVVGRFCGFEPKIGAISGPSFAKEVAEKHPPLLRLPPPIAPWQRAYRRTLAIPASAFT